MLQALFIVLALGVPVVAIGSWIYDLSAAGITVTAAEPAIAGSSGRGSFQNIKRVVRSATGALLVVLLLYLLFAYAWPDDYPSDDVRRLHAMMHERSSDPNTFGYGLYGLSAPAGQDMWQYGRYLVATYNATGEWVRSFDSELRFAGESWWYLPSINRISEDLEAVPELLEQNQQLIARYAILREANNFSPVIRIDVTTPSPDYRALSTIRRLRLREALMRLRDGDHESAWKIVDDELVFYRRMLAGSADLIQKATATAAIYEVLQIRAIMVVRAAEQGGTLPPAPARLSRMERSLVEAMRAYASYLLQAFELRAAEYSETFSGHHSEIDNLAILLLPYKRNRTANSVVGPMMEFARASVGPVADMLDRQNEFVTNINWWFEWLINGGGSVRIRETGFVVHAFWPFFMRLQALDAMLALSQAAHAVVESDATKLSVHGHLLSLGDRYRNPINGSLPVWREGVLSFETPVAELPDAHQPRLRLPLPE